jgi:hypothetical protein
MPKPKSSRRRPSAPPPTGNPTPAENPDSPVAHAKDVSEPKDVTSTDVPQKLPSPEKHPGGRETLLTTELQQRIVSYIRAGAFDWVAAEANGIDRHTFWEWVRRGESEDERPQTDAYAKFAKKVREARAEARLSAEVEVKRGERLSWLMKGPGRHQPDAPGWTNGDGDATASVTAIKVEIVYARDDQAADHLQVTTTERRQLPEPS